MYRRERPNNFLNSTILSLLYRYNDIVVIEGGYNFITRNVFSIISVI